MKKLTAIFLCLILALQIAPTGAIFTTAEDTTEYYAGWAGQPDEWGYVSAPMYDDISGTPRYDSVYNGATEQFTVRSCGVQDGVEWYYVTDENWPAYRGSYRYLKGTDIRIISAVEPEITYGDIAGGVGSFSVSVSGAPTDAELAVQQISEPDYDYEGLEPHLTGQMGGILGAYDMKIMRNGEEWQPEEGNPVTVTTSAGALGLFTGDLVYVINVHEENGEKTYYTHGPITVENGNVVFQTDKFSDYYYLKGNNTRTLNNDERNDVIYLEPGAVITLNLRTDYNYTYRANFTDNSNGMITYEGTTLRVDSLAKSGDYATIVQQRKGSWENNYSNYGTTRIEVKTRKEIVEYILGNDKKSKLMIAILDQKNYSQGNFPSEPGNTEGTYWHVTNNGGTYGLQSASANFADRASNYINAEMANSSAWMYDPAGSQIYGLVDGTGRSTLAAFTNANGEQTVDWDQVAKVIAEYNTGKNKNNKIAIKYNQETNNGLATHVVYLSTDTTKTIASYGNKTLNGEEVYYKEFNLIPYVVKYMTDNVWHVDVACVRGDSYMLVYDVNLGNISLASSSKIKLPDAKVYVENPADNDTTMSVKLDDWSYKNTTFTVYDNEGTDGTMTFKGWGLTPTATTYYQPGDTITISSAETKLYAIWELSPELRKQRKAITIINTVLFSSSADANAIKPVYGATNFVPFTFVIDLDYDDTFSYVTFEFNKISGINNGVTQWATVSGTLAGVHDGTETYDFISMDDDSITLIMYDGESIKFSEVPVYSGGQLNSFTVTETITQVTDKYSTQNGSKVLTQSMPAVMSESADTICQFYTYYTPPVAGIEVSAVNGGDGEIYIFKISLVKSSAISRFTAITFAVPAGSSVSIAKLAIGTYKVERVTAWDTNYSADKNSAEITVQDGKTHNITFTFSANGEPYIYGHDYNTTIQSPRAN